MENQDTYKLLFIYNANSGLRNALLDSAHKILSPATYDCNLCDITFGVFSENTGWKQFREGSKVSMEFLHKDEFTQQYASKFGHKFTFPIVLAVTHDKLEVLVSTQVLNDLKSAEELIQLIEEHVG
ncbi:GTPase [Flavobacteriaceae bacterium 3-367]|uniref:GTPase n=1 Tax=Eudoraea algarum TaxID=3417568 RepID=UPI003280857C